MIAFALGFASGNYLGSYIEEKIALGYSFAYVVPKNYKTDLARALREQGFGVTVLPARGLRGPEPVFNVTFRRRETRRFIKTISKHDGRAFYTI